MAWVLAVLLAISVAGNLRFAQRALLGHLAASLLQRSARIRELSEELAEVQAERQDLQMQYDRLRLRIHAAFDGRHRQAAIRF